MIFSNLQDSLQDGGPNAAKAVLLEKPKAPID